MIECTECNNYANMIYERGEIPQEEITKVAIDRHILKGCDAMPKTISTGSLLFHCADEGAIEGILHKIREQMINYCSEGQESFLYRIDWKIIHGKTFES